MDRWLTHMRQAGSRGGHLAVGEANPRAVGFYRRYGFRELMRAPPANTVIWFGMVL
jgi:ribosomal protein S18 acetylase RimI-like enzyme